MSKNKEIALKQQITQLTQAKKYSHARDTALKLVALNPKDIEAWFALAQLQEHLGEAEAAVDALYQVCQGPSPMFGFALQKTVSLCQQHGLDLLGIPPSSAAH